jgi:hypothetical protein
MSIGIEEGWLTAPKSSGELSPPLNLKSKTRTIDLINEDRGSAYLGWGESHEE